MGVISSMVERPIHGRLHVCSWPAMHGNEYDSLGASVRGAEMSQPPLEPVRFGHHPTHL